MYTNFTNKLRERNFQKYIYSQTGGIISFGGGEPTLLDEFEDLVTFLLDNYFWGILFIFLVLWYLVEICIENEARAKQSPPKTSV